MLSNRPDCVVAFPVVATRAPQEEAEERRAYSGAVTPWYRRQVAGVGTGCSHCVHSQEAEGVGSGWGNKVSRPDPSEHVFKGIEHPEKFHSLPNSTTRWRPRVPTPEPMGTLQIDPTKRVERSRERGRWVA